MLSHRLLFKLVLIRPSGPPGRESGRVTLLAGSPRFLLLKEDLKEKVLLIETNATDEIVDDILISS